jgi:hypothetical protein
MVDKEFAKEFHPAKYIAEGSGVGTWFWYVVVSGLLTMILFGILGQLLVGLGLWFIYVLYLTASLIATNHSVRKGATVRSAVKMVNRQVYYGNKTPVDRIIERRDVPNKPLDLKNYIINKANRNVMIVGTAGQGKSKLTRYLLELFDNQKVIFSFKPNDEYLKMGYTIIETSKALPNAFRDIEAFVNAFAITFPMTTIGITAQYIPSYLREIGKESKNWDDFSKRLDRAISSTKNQTQMSALLYLREHMKPLYSDSMSEVPELDENVVFDFSSLNEDAKTFYAELLLRQVWKDMTMRGKRGKDVILCVDEAHRLLRTFEKYESIYGEMSREIRAFGMLWTATQNYTDIPSHVRNQFATQFLFNTNHQDDLVALRAIDEKLSWAASSMPKHCFTDARYEWVHQVIPEFSLFWEAEDKPRAYYEARAKAEPLMPSLSSGRPTPTVHATMLATQYNPDATLKDLAKWLRENYAYTDNTIYGFSTRGSVFDTAISLGFLEKRGKAYRLTDNGKKWVDPATILKDELNAGSDLHKQILAKTIEKLHESNMLVIAPREREAHDLIAYPVDKRKKYLWDDNSVKAYEIQTTGRKDKVLLNKAKESKYGMPITWVTYDKGIMDNIKELTANKDDYMLVSLRNANGE